MRVRFAPSPTGALHIGGARTALYNWLLARGQAYGPDGKPGTLVLRIEDTDRERSTPENVEQILDALQVAEPRLGRGPGVPVRAGRAPPRGARAAARVRARVSLERDRPTTCRAYKERHGFERGYRGVPEGEGAVRLRVPDEGETMFDDIIRGQIRFANASMDDFVIARADGSVLYAFANLVDDLDAGITDVVRGEDHISNTPKQLLVLDALGTPPPRYAHLPLLHGPDGRKLSKRHGAASVQELRAAGYLPEAVDNYIALLGAGFAADEEFFTLDELAERFRLERVSKNPAVFDERKLRHLNGRWIRELGTDELTERLEEFTGRDRTARRGGDLARRRSRRWPISGRWSGFLFDGPADDPAAFEKVIGSDGGVESLKAAREALARRGAVHRRERRGGPARGGRAPGREVGQGVPAGTGRDRRHDRVAGHLRERRAARTGRDTWRGSTRALEHAD